MNKNGQVNKTPQQYSQEWYDMMVTIWRDRITLLDFLPSHTGKLLSSVQKKNIKIGESDFEFVFQFVEYGIYVDNGTGNGYKRGNPGDLEILDKSYRYEHGMKRQRNRRPWFSISWDISTRVIKDAMAYMLGEKFSGLFDILTSEKV